METENIQLNNVDEGDVKSPTKKILSTLVGFILVVGSLTGIALYFNESLFFPIGIGITALFSQLAKCFKSYSLPWWLFWVASLSWLTFCLINIRMFLPA